MKKILTICLCVLVGLFSFAGCATNDNSDKPNGDSGWTGWH